MTIGMDRVLPSPVSRPPSRAAPPVSRRSRPSFPPSSVNLCNLCNLWIEFPRLPSAAEPRCEIRPFGSSKNGQSPAKAEIQVYPIT